MRKIKKIALTVLVLAIAAKAYAFTTTANMSLKIPVSGDTDYPTSISDSFTLIDAHDHTTGKGVQIPAGGIASLAVTGAKLNSNVVDNATLQLSASILSIKDLGVTTAKINDLAVTPGKRSAAVYTRSASGSGIFTEAAGVYTDITNLSVSFASTGRPAIIMLIPEEGTIGPAIEASRAGAGVSAAIKFLYNGVDIAEQQMQSLTDTGMQVPPSSFQTFWIPPAPATYTIKAQGKRIGGGVTLTVANTKLVVFEL